MAKRQAGMVALSQGAVGIIYPMVVSYNGTKRVMNQHSAYGARARMLTNRSSGLTVELITNHGSLRAGTRLQIAAGEFVKS